MFIPKKPNDHTLKQILAGEIAVSDLKRGDKTEALIVRYECRNGTQRTWISPIGRPKTDGVAFRDALEMRGKACSFAGHEKSCPIKKMCDGRLQIPHLCSDGVTSGDISGR